MNQQELLRELEATIRTQVRSGFYSRSQVMETIRAEYLSDSAFTPWLTEDRIRQMTDQEITQQLQTQRNWPRFTDCDRLDTAFAALEREGIVARQDYSCCQTCGHKDIQDELAQSGEIRGYVFFHHHDTEMALAGHGLMLSYGARDGNDREQVQVGQRIVFALRDAGLQIAWSGNPYERIYIRHFNWQRRFPMREAA
ncbi:MAG: hypothetical protein KC496_06780 [Anaerolineae bacterium]|nr:hypothetical protein [Anaerolineae bacterium]